MPFLKMPAALRWLWVICILLLLMMTGYRVLLVTLFSNFNTPKPTILLTGIVRDAGVIAIIGIVFMTLSSFRLFHPYRSKKGLYMSMGYFSVGLFLILLVYALDLVSIKTFGQRLSGTKFMSLFRGNPRKGEFVGNFPIIYFTVGVILAGWVWWMLIDYLHIWLGMMDRAIEKSQRFLWYSITLIVFATMIWFSIRGTVVYKYPLELSVGRSTESALKVNPIFSLLFL
jgi:hypothetical protein